MLLTTQYLDEADQLADRIAIIDQGKVIAEGTSGELKSLIGSRTLHVRVHDPEHRPVAGRVLSEVIGESIQLEPDPAALSVRAPDPERAATALAELSRAGVAVTDMALGQPSLDEVFLTLTGHPAEKPTAGEGRA